MKPILFAIIFAGCAGAHAADNDAMPLTVLEVGFTLDGGLCDGSTQAPEVCCPVGFEPVGLTANDRAVICLEVR